MIHQPLGGVRGQATDIEIEAREIIRMLDRVNKLIADATGQPLEKVKKTPTATSGCLRQKRWTTALWVN